MTILATLSEPESSQGFISLKETLRRMETQQDQQLGTRNKPPRMLRAVLFLGRWGSEYLSCGHIANYETDGKIALH
jgi:hypothetical protein